MRPQNTRVWRKGLRRAVRTHPRLSRPADDSVAAEYRFTEPEAAIADLPAELALQLLRYPSPDAEA